MIFVTVANTIVLLIANSTIDKIDREKEREKL